MIGEMIEDLDSTGHEVAWKTVVKMSLGPWEARVEIRAAAFITNDEISNRVYYGTVDVRGFEKD